MRYTYRGSWLYTRTWQTYVCIHTYTYLFPIPLNTVMIAFSCIWDTRTGVRGYILVRDIHMCIHIHIHTSSPNRWIPSRQHLVVYKIHMQAFVAIYSYITYICVYTYTYIPLLQTVEYRPDRILRHVRCLLLLLHHGPPSPPFTHEIQMYWASFMCLFVYMRVSSDMPSQGLLFLQRHMPPSPPFTHGIQMYWASFMCLFVYMLVSFAMPSQGLLFL